MTRFRFFPPFLFPPFVNYFSVLVPYIIVQIRVCSTEKKIYLISRDARITRDRSFVYLFFFPDYSLKIEDRVIISTGEIISQVSNVTIVDL